MMHWLTKRYCFPVPQKVGKLFKSCPGGFAQHSGAHLTPINPHEKSNVVNIEDWVLGDLLILINP